MAMLHHALRRRSISLTVHLQRGNIVSPACYLQVNAFSSQSNVVGAGKKNDQANRVPKTLYRQLLSWCRRYDNVPFNPLPPVTLSPPQVDPIALKRLKEMRAFLAANEIKGGLMDDEGEDMIKFGQNGHPAHYAMYKEDIVVKEDMITFPEIGDANELRATIRSIYWLNNKNTIANVKGAVGTTEEQSNKSTKEQISLAFDAMKSCNQLSSSELDSRRSKREFSMKVRQGQSEGSSESAEFPNVEYHVGQVVKHRDKWRGVVVGWAIDKEKNNDDRLSSLTTKQYSLKEDETSSTDRNNEDLDATKSKVKYTVLVDSNDASLLQSSKTVTIETQDDLLPVDDPCLQRIHNNLIKQYFTKFSSGHFVPNNVVAYVFGLDKFGASAGLDAANETSNAEPKSSPELEQSNLAITKGVQEISRRLLSPLAESIGQQQENDDDEALSMISLMSSHVESMSMKKSSAKELDSAISLLAKLYHFHVKINSLLWARNANEQHEQHINYKLGQVVKHKVYGFKGVIAAWDPKPRMDVSNWDGLTEVENPQEKPFYHVYPDVNDCIRVFGGPRHFRYVCQDNLELIPHNEGPLDLEMDMDSEGWKWDGERGRYIPSAEMKFTFGEDLGEHETMLVAAVRNLRKLLTECLLEIRDEGNNDLFSMDDLFCQLQVGAENLEDATVVQDTIREIWKETSNCDLRNQLDNGIAELMEGNHELSLDTFTNIVASDPLYGEAWNKKATVHYMMGEKDDSIKSAEEALKLDKRNFQALAGMGLIEMDSSRYEKAIESFRKCLLINPW
eukprot:CAMPEP_0172329892 /NCGR_PEP_ID=MMETSP1058-20130122/61118_1 /TAXON_ID=83371 /ORGANISM="Detonula confervacea, Strain CCMP 353" /LENGTH=788 /DNA_ID=CAMNT_0013047085 /DNA_START=10 /DNA_END=2373 /DNA_ORIENTATION=+